MCLALNDSMYTYILPRKLNAHFVVKPKPADLPNGGFDIFNIVNSMVSNSNLFKIFIFEMSENATSHIKTFDKSWQSIRVHHISCCWQRKTNKSKKQNSSFELFIRVGSSWVRQSQDLFQKFDYILLKWFISLPRHQIYLLTFMHLTHRGMLFSFFILSRNVHRVTSAKQWVVLVHIYTQ